MKKWGCAALAAAMLFFLFPIAAAADGMPVDVAAAEQAPARAPTLGADCAVLMDGASGKILLGQNENKRCGMASTTKIMTALVAIENGDLTKSIRVPREAVGIEGSSIYLCADEELTLEQLLYALLLQSANDAAVAIAAGVCGSVEAFCEKMNEKAQVLWLENTHFSNPHGLSSKEHYASAADLARLGAYAMQNETFAKIVGTYRTEIPMKNGEGKRLLINHNRLLKSYDGALGIKTGYTKESGRCLVSAAQRDGLQLIAVTLDDANDWADHRALFDYGFATYERVELCRAGEYSLSLPVVGAAQNEITLQNETALCVTLPRAREEIKCRVLAPRFFYAPLAKGKAYGTLQYFCGKEPLGELPLLAAQDCKAAHRPSLWEFFITMLRGKKTS